MRLELILILMIGAFLIGSTIGQSIERTITEAKASPRSQAIACWHEFQSGRRATTADCPEL